MRFVTWDGVAPMIPADILDLARIASIEADLATDASNHQPVRLELRDAA